MEAQTGNRVAVFDFDHTIIDTNSDTYIDKLMLRSCSSADYPVEIEEIYKQSGWTHRMNAVFKHLNQVHNVTKEDFEQCLKEIQLDETMKSLINRLKSLGYKLVIISDANRFFIETILTANEGLLTHFDQIYTNESHFDHTDSGCLKLTPLSKVMNQNGEPFACETRLCASNICKGFVLSNYLQKQAIDRQSSHLIYVGDGRNDYCPALHLHASDFLFVRSNYALHKLLSRNNGEMKAKLAAEVNYWQTAQDILQRLEIHYNAK